MVQEFHSFPYFSLHQTDISSTYDQDHSLSENNILRIIMGYQNLDCRNVIQPLEGHIHPFIYHHLNFINPELEIYFSTGRNLRSHLGQHSHFRDQRP